MSDDASRTIVPMLKNGDHLTRAEFERRYEAMPEIKKAEMIEGVVFIGGPVPHSTHARPHAEIAGWLGVYSAYTSAVEAGNGSTAKLDADNMLQPDCVLFLKPEAGGQVRLDAKGYVTGSPELVAEIAASSVSIDLNEKHKVYRRSGVKEYLVWRVEDQKIDWFVLREGV